MISCSMIHSLIGARVALDDEGVAARAPTPRSARRSRRWRSSKAWSARGRCRAASATSSASSGCARPEKTMRFFSVVRLIPVTGRASSGPAAAVSPLRRLGGRRSPRVASRCDPAVDRCAAVRWRRPARPGGTSSVTTVPAPVAAPSPDRRPARRTVLLRRRSGVRADPGAVLGHAVVVGEDRAGADVGALADLGVPDIGQVRDLGARRRSGVLGLDERRRSCRRRPAPCRAAGRRTARPSRPGRSRASEPWVRTTRAPSPTSTSVSVVSGPIDRAGGDRASRRCSWMPGCSVTSAPS